MLTPPYLRSACEECHARKIRCKPSAEEGRCNDRCEACRLNNRKCLFSLRSKTGRPRNPTLPYNSPYLQSAPSVSPDIETSCPSTSPITPSSIIESKATTPLVPHNWRKATAERNTQAPDGFNYYPDGLSEAFPACLNVPLDFSRNDPARGSTPSSTNTPTQSPFPSPDAFAVSAYRLNDMLPTMDLVSAEQSHSNPPSSYPKEASSWVPVYQLSGPRPPQTTPPQSESRLVFSGTSGFDNWQPDTVSDIVQTIGLCNELRSYAYLVPGKSISILSSRDTADVHQILMSIDNLCTKIENILPHQQHSVPLKDQPGFILIFSVVIQVIEQTVDRLGSVVEFEQVIPTDDFPINDLNFHGYFRSMQIHEHISEKRGQNAARKDQPQLELECLLYLTRLDFYLLRLRSFIAHFDTSFELLAATENTIYPTRSSARLLAYHRCLERLVWCLKDELWK